MTRNYAYRKLATVNVTKQVQGHITDYSSTLACSNGFKTSHKGREIEAVILYIKKQSKKNKLLLEPGHFTTDEYLYYATALMWQRLLISLYPTTLRCQAPQPFEIGQLKCIISTNSANIFLTLVIFLKSMINYLFSNKIIHCSITIDATSKRK